MQTAEMGNGFQSFSRLPEELQLEAIREGEAQLEAQLSIATAADQRALTWAGLLVATATGALGGGLALLSRSEPDYLLGIVSLSFAAGIVPAAWKALRTVQPGRFSIPGNSPENWLPENWSSVGKAAQDKATARREQAQHLARRIAKNYRRTKVRARLMRESFTLTRRTLIAGAIVLAVILVIRWLIAYWNFASDWLGT